MPVRAARAVRQCCQPEMTAGFLAALLLSAGYNSALVAIGAALLGAAGGAAGTFAILRGRSLVADATSHATLPGICLGFLAGHAISGDGRSLPLLLTGAAISACAGFMAIGWIMRKTRLYEDAAIGTVLSTFFAAGVLLLTAIQNMPGASQAGLETFLLGSGAGMLQSEALLIAVLALCVGLAIGALVKELSMLAFDDGFAASLGLRVARLDLILMMLITAIIIVGLKTVGLVLAIAMTIIPPVTARLWARNIVMMVLVAAFVGALGAYMGAALSASAENMPTGAVIVLTHFALLCISALIAPQNGAIARLLRHFELRRQIHLRQGLLALAHGAPVFDRLTLRLLRAYRHVYGDGTASPAGIAAARRIAEDQALWNQFRTDYPLEAMRLEDWSMRPIDQCLPADIVAGLRARAAHGPPGQTKPGPAPP